LCHFGDPVSRTDLDLFGFGHRITNGVANVSIARFCFGLISRTADVSILGFVDRFTNRTADLPLTCLVAGLANRTTHIAVAGLDTGLADGARDVAVAGLVTGLANGARDVAVAGLVTGLADRVALVPVARFINIAFACHRDLFGALLIDGSATVDRLLFVDGLSDCLITRATAAFGSAIVAGRDAGCGRTAPSTGRSTIEGFDSCLTGERQQTRCEEHPTCVSHRSFLVPVKTADSDEISQKLTRCAQNTISSIIHRLKNGPTSIKKRELVF